MKGKTRLVAIAGAAALAAGGTAWTAAAAQSSTTAAPSSTAAAQSSTTAAPSSTTQTSFEMVRSATAVGANCLKNAEANVTIKSVGPVEVMTVEAKRLPRNTDFDLFVIQVPNAPFGLSWYQGDLQTDRWGQANGTFIGRFSIETFTVAPGTAPAPVVHTSPIPDASSNPATAPVHQYHLGLWFNSPADAVAAGCPGTLTPFNGEHTAGVQALSTRQFPDDFGPLRRIHP
jgi:hypothetical protein